MMQTKTLSRCVLFLHALLLGFSSVAAYSSMVGPQIELFSSKGATSSISTTAPSFLDIAPATTRGVQSTRRYSKLLTVLSLSARHHHQQSHRRSMTFPIDATAAPMVDLERAVTATTATTAVTTTATSAASSFKQQMLQRLGISSGAAVGKNLRQKVAKMGVFAAISYAIVSQINSGASISIAWYLYSSKTGFSPLAPGHWKGYLGFYAGFWVVNNVLRPVRLALAVGMASRTEKLTLDVQNRFQFTKPQAITATAVASYLLAMSVSATFMALAAAFSGIPVFPSSP